MRCQLTAQTKGLPAHHWKAFLLWQQFFYSLAITMAALMAKTPPGKVQLLGFSCG